MNWFYILALIYLKEKSNLSQSCSFFKQSIQPVLNKNKTIIQIAAGYKHTVFLRRKGSVEVCGDNTNGQLGLGDTKEQLKSINVPGLSDISQIVAGDFHTLFLKKDGSVFACGYNDCGQLGLGDKKNRYTPTLMPSFGPIVEPSKSLTLA